MIWKKPLIAFVVFLLLTALWIADTWWVENQKVAKSKSERAFPEVVEDDVIGMDLITPEEIISVKKVDKDAKPAQARWDMTQPLQTRADADAITVILSNLVPAMRYGEFDVTASENLEDYGLNEPKYTLKLTDKDARVYTLVIGDQAPQSGKFYAKLENESKIFSINEYIKDKLEKKPFDLRDRTVLNVAVDDVKRLTMARAIQMPIELISSDDSGGTISTTGYQRKAPEDVTAVRLFDGSWQLQKPVEWLGDDIEIENMLRTLKTEKVTAFFDEPSTGGEVDYGFESPQIELTVEQIVQDLDGVKMNADGTTPMETLLLVIGDRVSTGTKKEYYAKRKDGPVIAVDSGLFDAVAIKATKLRNKKMFTMSPEDVAHAEFIARRGASRVRLDKNEDGTWVFADDAATSVDQSVISDKIVSLLGLRAKDFEKDNPTPADLDEYKLDTPFVRVTVSNADRTTTEGISIGDLATREEQSIVFAQRIGQPSVVLLDFTKPMQLAMTKESLKDRSLFQFDRDAVFKADVNRGGTTLTLTRTGDIWKLDRAGLKSPIEVSTFTAEDVSRGVADLKYKMVNDNDVLTEEQMGLTSPTLTVVLFGKGGTELAHVTRGIEKGKQYYTKIAPGGPVYGVETPEFASMESAIDSLLKQE